MSYHDEYIMTVGIEVHAELKTKTKIFCSCSTDFGNPQNTQICPICMGLPGTLPSLNRRVVEYAIRAGLACGCEISLECGMDRKNYFYPDLPKAFQISQYYRPLCHSGRLHFECDGEPMSVGIERIHIEEDAGKLIHMGGQTLIDYNRCGVPLIEIVSAPEIHSPSTAREYLSALRTTLLYIGVSDCKMNEGSMRCDVNISVARKGSDSLGTKTEIKNINSFAFAQKAIEYEFLRQAKILFEGGEVEHETRRYNESNGRTEPMRKKESGADYRFFPEPDIPPLMLKASDIEAIQATLPEAPLQKLCRFRSLEGISDYDAHELVSEPSLAYTFDAAQAYTKHKKAVANLLLGEGRRLCPDKEFSCPIPPAALAELAELQGSEKISASVAKRLFCRLWEAPLDMTPSELCERETLWQINDRQLLTSLAHEAIEKNPRSVHDFKSGRSNALRALQGYIMKSTDGRANPSLAENILHELLKKL